MITSRHFKEYEFQNCSPVCSLQDMDQSAINRFDLARDYAKMPFKPVSAKRTPEWEISKGRSGTGAHTTGNAMDIECLDSRSRFIMITSLLRAGFTRLGIAKTYIHADDSISHDQEVVWLY